MTDFSRRNFLTMIGIATTSVATLDLQQVAAAVERIPLPDHLSTISNQLEADISKEILSITSDCFITRRGVRYPIGRLFQMNVERRLKRYQRSGLESLGYRMTDSALNIHDSTIVDLQTYASIAEAKNGQQLMFGEMEEAYTILRSAGDVSFSVDSVLPNGDKYAFDCAHAYPYALELGPMTLDGSDLFDLPIKFSMKLTMVDDFKVRTIPAHAMRGAV